MKKLILMGLLAFTMVSCSTESNECGCDRVTQVDPATFLTKNDCSEEFKAWLIVEQGTPKVGDCFKPKH